MFKLCLVALEATIRIVNFKLHFERHLVDINALEEIYVSIAIIVVCVVVVVGRRVANSIVSSIVVG